jgi:hypothetical protein
MDSQVQIDKVQVEQLLKTEETRPMPGNVSLEDLEKVVDDMLDEVEIFRNKIFAEFLKERSSKSTIQTAFQQSPGSSRLTCSVYQS